MGGEGAEQLGLGCVVDTPVSPAATSSSVWMFELSSREGSRLGVWGEASTAIAKVVRATLACLPWSRCWEDRGQALAGSRGGRGLPGREEGRRGRHE